MGHISLFGLVVVVLAFVCLRQEHFSSAFIHRLSISMVATKTVTQFQQKVYKACSAIPKGKVCTYKELAKKVGSPNAVRAVGSALRNNPFAPKVPCHRVVASDRSLGGFSGSKDPDGPLLKKKRKMLEEEGVVFEDNHLEIANLKVASESLHEFDNCESEQN
jgi:methylated-DNA-[protein]-cysteine S-methyltransferase